MENVQIVKSFYEEFTTFLISEGDTGNLKQIASKRRFLSL